MTVSVGSTITTANYNDIRDIISLVLNPSIGGYGPNILKATTATTNIIAGYEHWNALYTDVNNCIKHQTGADVVGVTPPAVGDLIRASFVNNLETAANTAVANSFTVHVSQLAAYNTTTTFIDIPWDSQVQNVTSYTWPTDLRANYHFNLGGSIRSTIGLSTTTAITTGTQGFLEFVGHANNPGYSTLITDPYTRARWIAPSSTTVTNYSTSTIAGVFTATVTYARTTVGAGVDTVTVTTEIYPPPVSDPITILPINTGTLFYSTDAISAVRPAVVTDRKILEASALQPFNFSAGTRSNPQILTLSNTGAEPISISNGGIIATNYGVLGYAISTATNLTDENPVIVPLSYPITIAPNDDYNIVVYYLEPVSDVTQVGKFYNSIIITSDADDDSLVVPTEQNVTVPEFNFNLILTDPSQQYTYDNWQTEFGLSGSDKTLGINIANTYYLSNTDFGIIDGKRRFGLFRKPDANGLKGWVDYTKASLGGDYTQLTSIFFRGVDAGGTDNARALTANKFFDPGFGYGDLYDKTLVNLDLSSSNSKRYQYNIQPFFGSLNASLNFPGYTATLSNQEFNGSPSEEATAAFSVIIDGSPGTGTILKGPGILFSPVAVNNIGAYSTDLTVTVTATGLNGDTVTRSKTVNLSLNMTTLVDGNLVKWLSGFETDNAVIGISYDRIGGTTYLTVGVGSGADGAPTLAGNNYLPTYVDVNRLGIAGDERWGTFPIGFGMPMYRITYSRSWSGFMNAYAVWPRNPSFIGSGYSSPVNVGINNSYKFTAASTGEYTVEFAADDYGNVSIDGQLVIEGRNFTGSSTNTFNINSIGEHTVGLGVINSGGGRGNPGGIAVTIRNPAGNIIWSTLDTVRSTPPYLYWPEVYRIPIESNVARAYQLGQYRVKDFAPVNDSSNYGAYFGTPATASAGSIITVDSDGKGNLTFNWNPQSATSGTGADTTLANIPSLQYAYSYLESRKRNFDNSGLSLLSDSVLQYQNQGVSGTVQLAYTIPSQAGGVGEGFYRVVGSWTATYGGLVYVDYLTWAGSEKIWNMQFTRVRAGVRTVITSRSYESGAFYSGGDENGCNFSTIGPWVQYIGAVDVLPGDRLEGYCYLWGAFGGDAIVGGNFDVRGTVVLEPVSVPVSLEGGPNTQRLTGMTIRNPRYTTVPTPGFGRIEVQSNINSGAIFGIAGESSLKISGRAIASVYSRGHTLAVITPLTFVVESITTYDTFGAGSSAALTTALNNVATGKIIAIISNGITVLNQTTRDLLISKFSAPLTTVWDGNSYAHAFVGKAFDASFGSVERITDSGNIAYSSTVWPFGPTGVFFAPPDFGGNVDTGGVSTGDGGVF
jgi:hypothetical protein